jgi:aquaporin Z
MNDMKKYAAEFVGTLALVLIGCASAVIAGKQIGILGISFAFGLTLLAMIYAIGPISGCHINPAITLSMLSLKKISVKDALLYIISQCAGAIVGAAILLVIVSGMPRYSIAVHGLGQNGFGRGYQGGFSLESAFIAEVVLSCLLVLVILGATSIKAPLGFAGIPVGLALVFIHLVGIRITGTSVNPARSLGPAVLVGGKALDQLWLFFAAPILGALIAALIWKYLLEETY